MFNKELEKDLTTYSQTQDAGLFNDKLYEPLSNLFKWLCGRQARPLNAEDFQDVQQTVMLHVIKKLKYYKPDNGSTAISFARMLMNQELIQCKRELEKQNDRHTEFDIDKHEHTATDTSSKPIQQYQEQLEKYKRTIPYAYRPIIDALIASLTDKTMLNISYAEKIKKICKQSGYGVSIVSQVMKEIKQAKLHLKID